ncbi:MAG: sulfotransferase [Actinomycetota bacterium]
MVVTRASTTRSAGARVSAGPSVLFIGGYARSGSTIVDRAVGAADGRVSVGEIRFIWRRGFLGDQPCGCGEPFGACGFWREVVATAWGGTRGLDVEEVIRLQDLVDRWWRIPQVGLRAGARIRRDLYAYAGALRLLYAAIRHVSGSQVIVDSSKDASHGWVLRGLGSSIDLSVLHLVRDSRAVAYSLCERRKYDPASGETWGGHGLGRTIAGWTATNALVGALGRVPSVPYLRLAYEEFCEDPDRALARVAVLLGEPLPSALGHRRIDPGIQHQVAGNPVRFVRGPIEIRPDDEWRRSMSPVRRGVVTAATWPMLHTGAP